MLRRWQLDCCIAWQIGGAQCLGTALAWRRDANVRQLIHKATTGFYMRVRRFVASHRFVWHLALPS